MKPIAALAFTALFILIMAQSLLSCKKSETKPVEKCTITSYVKSGNGTLKTFDKQFSVSKSHSEVVDVTDAELSIKLVNNVKSANDSIHLAVTYNGITKHRGVKCVNTIGTVSIYLSEF